MNKIEWFAPNPAHWMTGCRLLRRSLRGGFRELPSAGGRLLRSSAPNPPQPLNRPICSSQAGLSGGLAFFGHSLLAPTHQWIIAITGLACAIYSIPGQRITPVAAPSIRLTLCPYLQVTYLRLEYMGELQLTWVRRLPPCKERRSYPQSLFLDDRLDM